MPCEGGCRQCRLRKVRSLEEDQDDRTFGVSEDPVVENGANVGLVLRSWWVGVIILGSGQRRLPSRFDCRGQCLQHLILVVGIGLRSRQLAGQRTRLGT